MSPTVLAGQGAAGLGRKHNSPIWQVSLNALVVARSPVILQGTIGRANSGRLAKMGLSANHRPR